MKQPTQSTIAEAERWAEEFVVGHRVLLEGGAAKAACELVASALERGELPPKLLREYAATILRQAIKKGQRGTLIDRNGLIAHMLAHLEKQGIPLFPNRVGGRPGQTYGCDIVVEALKKAGISRVGMHTMDKVWSRSSQVFRQANAQIEEQVEASRKIADQLAQQRADLRARRTRT